MFKELVEKRRSIREFTEEPVKEEDLQEILATALSAPTACNRKPVEFIVIRDRELLKKLSHFKKSGALFLANAQVAVAVCMEQVAAKATCVQDASIASAYLELAVADKGLGSCWANIPGAFHEDGRPAEDVVRELLQVPETYGINCVIAIGHIAKEPAPSKDYHYKDHVHEEKF